MELKYFNIQDFDSPDEPGSGSLMDKEFLLLLDKQEKYLTLHI